MNVSGRPSSFRRRIHTHFLIGQWNKASEDFFESFRNYDEAGSQQRIQVLKYLVLANMLTGSEVNPFDSQETKPCAFPRRLHPSTALDAASFTVIRRTPRSRQ